MKFLLYMGVMALTGFFVITPDSGLVLPDSFVVNSIRAQTQTNTATHMHTPTHTYTQHNTTQQKKLS